MLTVPERSAVPHPDRRPEGIADLDAIDPLGNLDAARDDDPGAFFAQQRAALAREQRGRAPPPPRVPTSDGCARG
jgi:hypothetical protein